jgi:hypothetical protein
MAVGIATVYELDDRRGLSSSPDRIKNLHFSVSSRPALWPNQPPIQWVPGIKRHRSEADHSPATSGEAKKTWNYTSIPLPPIRLPGVLLSQLSTGTTVPFYSQNYVVRSITASTFYQISLR